TANSPRVAILHDVGKEALGVAALDIFDEAEILALDALGHRPIGAELVAEFPADVREIHARKNQHPAAIRVELGPQRRDERSDPGVARRHDSARYQFME